MKDLEAALKYGQEQPCRYGRKFEYKGLCYIVQKIGRNKWKELTCYAKSIGLSKVTVTPTIDEEYMKAKLSLANHSRWKSHTVIVVDTSGSMRNSDVWGAQSRLQAVWLCLALDFIAHRIESGEGGQHDVISVILMGESAKVLIKEEPTTWKLYNKIVDVYKRSGYGQAKGSVLAAGHGNYVPSLRTAEDLLTKNSSSSCALALCWMSDGRPSDVGDSRKEILSSLETLAQRFGRRLSFNAIAIGDDSNEFMMLQSMVETAKDYGAQATFVLPSMTTAGLGVSITATATSVTKTQTEMTNLSTLKQKNVRHVLRESRTKASSEVVQKVSSDEYWLYPAEKVVRQTYKVWYDNKGKRRSAYEDAPLQNPSTHFVALNKMAFGEGAERYAFRFFEVGTDFQVLGKPLVAKESRLVLDGGEAGRDKFVRTFCESQQLARRYASEFNRRLDTLRHVDNRTPRVSFLDCSIYELDDMHLGKQKVLVEDKIDHLSWHKWNMNNGYVEGMDEAPEFSHDKMEAALDHLSNVDRDDRMMGDLGAIEEGEEEAVSEHEDDEKNKGLNSRSDGTSRSAPTIQPVLFTSSEVAQAFSHFTYISSGTKRLICDLQGVFDASTNTLKFSDPVIHYFNSRRQHRRGVHGRTDRGRKGMAMFFATHKNCCGHLCKLVTGGFRNARKSRRLKDGVGRRENSFSSDR